MTREPASQQRKAGGIRIGRIAGVPVYVNWSWFIIAILIALIFQPIVERWVPGLGAWGYLAGLAFAVLLYGSVLLHEVSHVLVAKAYGLPVRAITLQLLGGVSEIEREPQTPWREFAVAVVGPLTSLGVAAAALGGLTLLDNAPSLVQLLILQLGLANLIVGLFNLLPGLPLDGGRMLRAGVWAVSKRPHTGTVVAAWAGRMFALMVAAAPWVLSQTTGFELSMLWVVWSLVIGVFLWAGSSQALFASQVRRKLPALHARSLARHAMPVAADLSVAEAIRRAGEARAGALIVVDQTGSPTALVSEAAVLAIPEHRRAWVPISDVARSLEPGLILSTDLIGEDLVRAMGNRPATEYLLLEPTGRVFGVLQTSDVDGAFAKA